MFVRVKKSGNNEYRQIAENCKIAGKIRFTCNGWGPANFQRSVAEASRAPQPSYRAGTGGNGAREMKKVADSCAAQSSRSLQ
jgi:hypothetical protein